MSEISVTKICNMALAAFAAEPITSIDQDCKTARVCKLFYQQTVDRVLRQFPFSCSIQRKQLAKSADVPLWGFAYAYPMPSNPASLKLLDVRSSVNDKPSYRLEAGSILTDEEDCYIKYVGKMMDPTGFDSLLVKAITQALAVEIVIPITASDSMLGTLKQLYDEAIAEARLAGCLEDFDETADNTSWVDAGRD